MQAIVARIASWKNKIYSFMIFFTCGKFSIWYTPGFVLWSDEMLQEYEALFAHITLLWRGISKYTEPLATDYVTRNFKLTLLALLHNYLF